MEKTKFTSGKLAKPWKVPIFPGKCQLNVKACGFCMAMLVTGVYSNLFVRIAEVLPCFALLEIAFEPCLLHTIS